MYPCNGNGSHEEMAEIEGKKQRTYHLFGDEMPWNLRKMKCYWHTQRSLVLGLL